MIIATHSPVGIDWSSRRADSQVIHVQHSGVTAQANSAMTYVQGCNILVDLDIRASDMLQSNGIIWVEGPSDRIYLSRWLDLASNGELKEGIHYTIMFYGGKLLAHLDALPPDESNELISLLAINRNAALLMDSDKHEADSVDGRARMNLNATKTRVKFELEKIEAFVWITQGREVENYTPICVYARVVSQSPPEVDSYAKIVELPLLASFHGDKVAIAHRTAAETSESDLNGHLDVWERLLELCDAIRKWNGAKAQAKSEDGD
jgi:putative ATP-dependent endonuclease of the OLD family